MFRPQLISGALAWLVACNPGGSDPEKDGKADPPVDEVPIEDADGDGVEDAGDNCGQDANPDQADVDVDGVGDACDEPPDLDVDGILDNVDNCAGVANADQADGDVDGFGDLCDNCPSDKNADQLDDDANGIGNVCPCDACAPGQWCSTHPDPAVGSACLDTCRAELQGVDGVCCPLGSRWYEGSQSCQLGDVFVDGEQVLDSANLQYRSFDPDSCEIVEGCVTEPGRRRLLRFDTMTPNIGAGDLYLGDPSEAEDIFNFSECHGHFHMDTYAEYQLLDGQGAVIAPGHKQAFCLMDYNPYADGVGWGSAEYHCGYQGISAGWADTYDSSLDCQFVDVTDVPEGDYVLRVTVNYANVLAESDYTNNVTEVPVHIPAP